MADEIDVKGSSTFKLCGSCGGGCPTANFGTPGQLLITDDVNPMPVTLTAEQALALADLIKKKFA